MKLKFIIFILWCSLFLPGCSEKLTDIPIKAWRSDQVKSLSSKKLDNLDYSREFFAEYSSHSTVGHLDITSCEPFCLSILRIIPKMGYKTGTWLKVTGRKKRNAAHPTEEFELLSHREYKTNQNIIKKCKEAIISNADRLANIDYTYPCKVGSGKTKLEFTKADILKAVETHNNLLIEADGQNMHFKITGKPVEESILYHYPGIDCVYNVKHKKVSHFYVYSYGYALE